MTEGPCPDAASLMAVALRLARRGLGQVWPNPSVGCVLARDGRIVGRGWTQPGGRPHAEAEALRFAGAEARGATAYVTLEPCVHHGRTPPCTEALIGAGVARVVVAIEDPDPRVAGGGVARLRHAGIDVEVGLGQQEAEEINRGFLLRITEGRPMFTLKLASSLDGRIATAAGESRWITGEAARARAHGLRASHDAVLVGVGTALADDPRLDCRLSGLTKRRPVRIVLDSRLRLPATAALAASARSQPTWVVTRGGADRDRCAALTEQGVEVIEVAADASGRPAIAATAAALAARGLTRVLLEGGGQVAAGFIAAGMIDDIAWFGAPLIIGGDGQPSVGALGIRALSTAPRATTLAVERLDGDTFGRYRVIKE